MERYKYKPTKLFYFLVISSVIAGLISPLVFGIVGGIWFFYALVNWGNKINEENKK